MSVVVSVSPLPSSHPSRQTPATPIHFPRPRSFLGGLTGRAGLAQLSDTFVSDPHLFFREGQSVRATVVQASSCGRASARQPFACLSGLVKLCPAATELATRSFAGGQAWFGGTAPMAPAPPNSCMHAGLAVHECMFLWAHVAAPPGSLHYRSKCAEPGPN